MPTAGYAYAFVISATTFAIEGDRLQQSQYLYLRFLNFEKYYGVAIDDFFVHLCHAYSFC
jgi:hypothetical protein